jgi:four helix bundle protein
MTMIKSFEEIEAWRNARKLTEQVYTLTNKGNFARDFGLKEQIRRAAVSIMSNIAEGFESHSRGIFMRYLNIAKGSAGEVRSQLYVASDQSYLSKTDFNSLCDLSRKISSQLANFRKHLTKKHY